MQFIDRIVRPCASGSVPLASVIVNPSNNTNIDVTPCTGGSLTVNGSTVPSGTVTVAQGGTGRTSFTVFAPIFGGITTTGALQSGTVGSAGQVLTSNGAGAIATFQTIPTVTPAALTRTSDTNVTLTLGGTPATALLQATSITVGWSGTLSAARGGFGVDVSAQSGVPLFAAGVATFTSTSGSGNFARVTSPVFVTPMLGAASATTLNGNTFTAGTYTLTGAASKVLTFNNTLTLAGTDGTTITFPATSATIARTDAGNAFIGNQTIAVGQTTSAQTDLLINPTTKASGNLVDYQVNSSSKYKVDFAGAVTANGNIVTNGNFQGGSYTASAGGTFTFSTRSIIQSPSDGVLLVTTNGQTDFGRLQLGGTTSSFPAIKRSGAVLQARLADDSAYTNIDGNSYLTNGVATYSAGTPAIAGNATLNTGSKDSAGKITSTGTGASTAVLTFSITFTRAPACLVTNETTSNLVRPVSTTTTLTFNATVVTGDSLSYICTGY